jgi:hypothetical protein
VLGAALIAAQEWAEDQDPKSRGSAAVATKDASS